MFRICIRPNYCNAGTERDSRSWSERRSGPPRPTGTLTAQCSINVGSEDQQIGFQGQEGPPGHDGPAGPMGLEVLLLLH